MLSARTVEPPETPPMSTDSGLVPPSRVNVRFSPASAALTKAFGRAVLVADPEPRRLPRRADARLRGRAGVRTHRNQRQVGSAVVPHHGPRRVGAGGVVGATVDQAVTDRGADLGGDLRLRCWKFAMAVVVA